MTSRLHQLYAWRAKQHKLPAEKIEETVNLGGEETLPCDVTLEPVAPGLAEKVYLLRKRIEIFNAAMTCDSVRIRGAGEETQYSTFVADPITAAKTFIIRNATPRPCLFFENVTGAQELVFELDSAQLLCSKKLAFRDTQTVTLKLAFRDSKLDPGDIKQMLRKLNFERDVYVNSDVLGLKSGALSEVIK
jgi:hypothetical protein